MKQISILFSIITSAMGSANAQTKTLKGCWRLVKMELPNQKQDSAEMVKAAEGAETCFLADGKFVSKYKTAKGMVEAGTGTYRINADGKTLEQRRDNAEQGEDADAEIVSLTDKELVLHIEQDHAVANIRYEKIPK